MTLAYTEYLDWEKLIVLQAALPVDHPLTDILEDICDKTNPDTGCLTVHYSLNEKEAPFGRLYANCGMQRLPPAVRNFIMKDDVKEYDIVNCYPVILRHIFRSFNIACHALNFYCTERDARLARAAKELHGSESQAKREFILAMLRGFAYTRSPLINEFAADVEKCFQKLMALESFRKFSDKVAVGAGNMRYRQMKFLIQQQERRVLQAAVNFAEDHTTVQTLLFDGFLSEPLPKATVRAMNRAVKEQTGIAVTFQEKPTTHLGVFEPPNLEPQDRLVLFEFNGVLGNYKRLFWEAGELRSLQAAGFKIGIFDNYLASPFPAWPPSLPELTVVLGREHYYKPLPDSDEQPRREVKAVGHLLPLTTVVHVVRDLKSVHPSEHSRCVVFTTMEQTIRDVMAMPFVPATLFARSLYIMPRNVFEYVESDAHEPEAKLSQAELDVLCLKDVLCDKNDEQKQSESPPGSRLPVLPSFPANKQTSTQTFGTQTIAKFGQTMEVRKH